MPFFVSAKSIILPPMPEWPGDRKPMPVSYGDIRGTIARHTTLVCDYGRPSDDAFTAIPTVLLGPAVKWTLAALKAQGVSYSANAFDCENFQRELCQTFAKIAARAGFKVAPATGGLSVVQKHAWAGTAASSGSHQVASVMTEHGLFIIEPQQPQLAISPIEAYPNRAYIFDASDF